MQAEEESGPIVAVSPFPETKLPIQKFSDLKKSQFSSDVVSIFERMHLNFPGDQGNHLTTTTYVGAHPHPKTGSLVLDALVKVRDYDLETGAVPHRPVR